MRIRTLAVVLTMVFMAGGLFAAEKVSFAGEWVFNEGKSQLDDMGAQFIPAKLIITQDDSSITVQKVIQREYEDDMVMEERVTLDGQECKSEFWNMPRVSTAAFSEDCKVITISTKIAFDQGDMTMNEAYSLDDTGKILTVKHHSSSGFGERDIKLVYDKKEAAPEAAK
jgi:hypothetical protein